VESQELACRGNPRKLAGMEAAASLATNCQNHYLDPLQAAAAVAQESAVAREKY